MPALSAYRAANAGVLAEAAAAVAAGEATFGDGLERWARASVGASRTPGGGRMEEAFADECRRHARRPVDAAIRTIDWHTAVKEADDDTFRFAVGRARLLPR
jgi:hypothetical protein